MKLPYVVYILKCFDNTFYTGYTTNIENRLKAHNKGEVHYTKSRLPVELINLFQFENKQKTYDFERYLKTGSGIAFRNKRLV
ncbi:GIY-YIG nuclease family protein [Winogradskyella echinorum]|uniref:GIY-YIG nuclease family protein n=1 Tax=Winogradskyella echinorum TaxID=538189 RepID=A0ABR6XXX3_9FLAO|nr:GIY-YIG nuclease family protein [Winogradskyella echinorum]MBC3844850.1 GIY-YIG nuclease family protein [Winogradskyella echinorum]MBC5749198.1 GIY-YIG nuclease family protein [Winogradskyella echinorum]